MGAENSVQQDGQSQQDASVSASASAGELSAEVTALQGSGVIDTKILEKNGQISSMTSLNGHSEDNTLAEVGQPDGVAQKEEAPETMDTIQDEVAPQVNGEKVEKESPDANEICAVEEKAAEVKPEDANEVGFKKIFRFVGFKFTLKKDKSEEKDPVKLLTIKDKEGEDVVGTEEPTKEEAVTNEEKSTAEEKEADTEAATAEAEVKDDNTETTDVPAEDAAAEDAAAEATAAEATAAEATAAEATDEAAKEEVAEKEGENTVSPFRKLFSGGLFSNLRKKASIKKTKEEENKEASAEEAAKTEEPAVEEKEEKDEVEQEAKEEAPTTPEEEKTETVPEAEVTAETPAAAAATTDETKPEKAEPSEEEKAPAEVTSEAELLSSQEKVKAQGSPLKKLFTGAGLKKLSTKKQKPKKDTETKLTESGEQAAETLQASTESTDAPKTDSEPSSPEEVEDNVAVGVTQNESDGEVASDGEKKKEGIIAWSSFKRLVTPKKRVKRPSESEDEAAAEKPAKSATLSSSESATLADKSVEEEAKEEKPTEEEPKTEDTEKLVSSTEEPKKKMDTSVSWEALMCMGGPKKRTRRTSDSDDEETKVEEESAPAVVEGEQEGKTEAAIVSSQTAESDGEIVSSSEPLSPQPERESTWDTLKRMVMPKNKAKAEEKPEEAAEPVVSDSEAPKDESSFSLRKLFPGRRKKKAEKQASTEQGEEDSDTPAVVPLSEYEDQAQVEQEAPAEPAEVQVKVSSEDRSPSWIPATVEDSDEKQLSDIPEEAENAATPKSVDTDIVEDETEDKSPVAPAGMGRRLSTAEVKPVAPTPSAETTPVPQGPKPDNAEEVIEGIQAEISEIPALAGVTVEDAPVEEVSVKTEYEPPTDTASTKTCAILEPHIKSEAMAICTGLGAKEIAKVATEKSAVPVLESMTEIRDALSTEVTVEDKEGTVEQATVDENAVLMIPQNHVEGTELEPVVETSHSDLSECIEAASESHEPKIETVGIVATVLEESEIIQPATTSENSPNGVRIIDSIAPISETAVCTQSLEVTEPIVQTKEMKMDVEQLAATESNTVNETVQYVPAEMASAICETTKSTIVKETEPTIPVIEPSEDVVISKTVVLVAPAASEAVCEETKLQAEETVEATIAQTAAVEISAAPELSSQDMEEMKEEVQETTEIEVQSMVIAQNVIQDAMDTVSEDVPAPQDPTTPTPVQAVATTEKEIEIPTESATISETPVAVCKPVSKLLHVATEVIPVPIPVEVTESLDEEKKPEEELKKAVEVKVSEETVVVEEVEEIKTVEEPEQVEEEESKEFTDVQEPDVKEAAEEVEPQSEEEKPEPPTEQNKEKVLEIHMPVQVVLQTAQVFEEPSVEEEAAEEFDCNGPAAKDDNVKVENKLSTVSEEVTASADVSTPSQVTEAEAPETPSGKCAEVMAQVIEVIEEAVKEIEPVSTEITAAS